jgi:hypothetical protein
MGAIAEAARRLMLRTGVGPMGPMWRLTYRLFARAIGAYLRRGSHDCSVYALGGVTGPEVVYGVSDIDLVVIAPGSPAQPGRARAAILARWERLGGTLPPLRSLVHVSVYEMPDLLRGMAGSPSLGFGGSPRVALEDALHQPSSFGVPPDVALRAGFGVPTEAWRLLSGRDRLADVPKISEHDRRVAAWLELQHWWRYAFTASLNPGGPRTPYTCVKLVAEPARIWIWLTSGERVSSRREALERALDELPEESEAFERALALQRDLHRAPEPPLGEMLAALVRMSSRIARRLAADTGPAGVTEVRLIGDREQELVPLADRRAIAYPADDDETLALVPRNPTDPRAIAALARAGDAGPQPAMRADDLLVLPVPTARRAKLRSVQSPLTDPVSFALVEGASVAAFPNVAGWSIQDIAARAVAEHRVWLTRRARADASRLLSAARAALLLESVEAGTPELLLTMAATAARLDCSVENGGGVAALHERVKRLPAYRNQRYTACARV